MNSTNIFKLHVCIFGSKLFVNKYLQVVRFFLSETPQVLKCACEPKTVLECECTEFH